MIQTALNPITVNVANVDHLLLTDVSWDDYFDLLRHFQRAGIHRKVVYDRGRLEIMTLGDRHERTKTLVARLVEIYALERDIPIVGIGSATLLRRKLKKGVEPDECYYVQTPPPVMSNRPLPLNKYPPPDLVIEVDISRGSIPRQPIYAALKVREIWRLKDDVVVSLHRQEDGTYEPADASLAFPELSLVELNRFVRLSGEASQHEAVRAFREFLLGTTT